ncbi:hypothetical protein SABR111722_07810 [Saccharibacillus brassicae]
MKKNKMILNLILSFLTGLLAFYLITRTITPVAVFACLAAVGVLALGYWLAHALKNMRNAKRSKSKAYPPNRSKAPGVELSRSLFSKPISKRLPMLNRPCRRFPYSSTRSVPSILAASGSRWDRNRLAFVSSAAICSRSFALSSKSKMSKFSTIRSLRTDFGMTTIFC